MSTSTSIITNRNVSKLYLEVADNCLKKAYDMFPSIRKELIDTADFSKLETYINIASSISAGFLSLNRHLEKFHHLGLDEDVALIASENILHTESFLLDKLWHQVKKANLTFEEQAELICPILKDVHDHRVSKFAQEWFFRPEWAGKEWRFLPTELVGFDELYRYRIFVEPILKRVGLHIDLMHLRDAYDKLQRFYLIGNDIESCLDLEHHLRTLQYHAAPESVLTAIRHLRSDTMNSSMVRLIRKLEQKSHMPWLSCARKATVSAGAI